jgi:UDP-N-acetylglucosamine--dolichyl-phosphate N-acetylglucosaminephosphotransferase
VTRTTSGRWLECNNLTLINVILMTFGPMKESNLALMIGLVQILGSLIGFIIRYGLVHIVYDSNGI